jgi:ABC-type Na+ efflux pump permease subunit
MLSRRQASEIDALYSEHGETMKLVLASVTLGLGALLVFLGALAEHLRSLNSAWTWTALASALMFMTALSVALGRR